MGYYRDGPFEVEYYRGGVSNVGLREVGYQMWDFLEMGSLRDGFS